MKRLILLGFLVLLYAGSSDACQAGRSCAQSGAGGAHTVVGGSGSLALPEASSVLSISASVACAPSCPLNGTTTAITVTVNSGTPTSMTFARDGYVSFALCPSSPGCSSSPSWGYTWCISSVCWAPEGAGSHTLYVVAYDSVSGQTASTSVTFSVVGDTVLTDLNVHTLPALPSIGGSGSKVTDPTFGTTIMRVTDATHPSSNYCQSTYSYWPTINVDSTKLKVFCVVSGSNRMFFMDMDPVAFTVSNLTGPYTAGGEDLDDAVWSAVDPDKMFLLNHNSNVLSSYKVSTGVLTTVHDFSPQLSAGQHVLQMSKANNSDDYFAVSRTDSGFTPIGYIAYKASTNTVLLNTLNTDTNEVLLSKNGAYLIVQANSGNAFTVNTSTGSIAMTNYNADTGFYHNAAMTNGLVAKNGATESLSYRTYAAPAVNVFSMVPVGLLTGGCPQYSGLADNDEWIEVSNCSWTPGTIIRALQDELYQVNVSTGAVRRLAHHRILWGAYEDQPNANISKDGQFVAFTSNWDGTLGRRDLFIVKIPAAPISISANPVKMLDYARDIYFGTGGWNASTQASAYAFLASKLTWMEDAGGATLLTGRTFKQEIARTNPTMKYWIYNIDWGCIVGVGGNTGCTDRTTFTENDYLHTSSTHNVGTRLANTVGGYGPFYFYNLHSSATRAKIVTYLDSYLSSSGDDMLWLDAHGYAIDQVASGGTIDEYGLSGSSLQTAYQLDMVTTEAAYYAQIHGVRGKEVTVNLSQGGNQDSNPNFRQEYTSNPGLSGTMELQFSAGIAGNGYIGWEGWFELGEIMRDAGGHMDLTYNTAYANYRNLAGGFVGNDAGSYASANERALMWRLAGYWIMSGGQMFFSPNLDTSRLDFATDQWLAAYDYQRLGAPIDTHMTQVFITAGITCGSGVYLISRRFENGHVFMRPGDNPGCSDFTDPYVITLSQPMKMLKGDGTLGAAVSTITVHNSEGIIMVKQ